MKCFGMRELTDHSNIQACKAERVREDDGHFESSMDSLVVLW